jgi:uncharacterized protein YdhG (YjbR/CyaY superfamily)
MNRGRPKSIDDFLNTLEADKRTALQRIRKTIKAVAPEAQECISYGLPAFRLNNRALVAFGATKYHCAFFPMDSTTISAYKEELKEFDTSKGTIRFQTNNPIPVVLIQKIVKGRVAEISKQKSKTKPRQKTTKKLIKPS